MKSSSYRLFFSVAICATFLLTQSTMAQVVDVDTSVSVDGLYSNWATNGNASLTAPVASSYNNYRKGGSGVVPTAADSGDGVLGTWSNINHAPTVTPCCGNPGMFFGNSPSTSSYADAVLQVGTNIEAGNAADNDTGGRRRFDMRVGFVESPADYVANFSSGVGHYDLWTGDWGTDGIQFNLAIGGTDDAANTLIIDTANGGNLIDPTNRWIQMSAAIRGQSGADSTGAIADERDRDRWRSPTNVDVNAIAPLAPTAADALQGALTITGNGNGARFDTGVALDGNVPLSWGMELNDPGNADPALARQVRLDVTAGDVTISQVFDPGDAANPVTPNSFSGVAFEDGFFDWQNSYPVFFLGPGGGAGVDPNAALTIGFEEPSSSLACDLDADGDCDGTDIEMLIDGGTTLGDIGTWLTDASDPANPYLGGTKTFLLGDANLDGNVDSVDLGLHLNNFSSTTNLDWINGNFNGDGVVDSVDLGLALNNFGAMSAAAAAVPEPAGLAMAFMAMLGLMGLRRRS